MKCLGSVAATALLLATQAVAASSSGWTRWALDLEERVLSTRTVCGTGGCSLFLLVRDADSGSLRHLHEVDLEDGSLRSRLREREAIRGLQVLTDESGEGRLLFRDDDALYALDPRSSSAPVRLLDIPEGSGVRRVDPDAPLVATLDVGELIVYDLGTPDAPPRVLPLPIEVDPDRNGLALRSPRVRPLAARPTRWVVGPQVLGNLRLRSEVLDPLAPPAPPEEADVRYSMLPALERVTRSFYTQLDDEPILGVVTLTAEKQGVLERKKLRLFRLRGDRTRSGERPFFEVLSASRIWQRLDVRVAEVTGDGTTDLILVQPEGFAGEKLLVDVFPGSSRGFESQYQRTVVKTPAGGWLWSSDLTGDGRPDLVVQAGDSVELWSLPAPRRRKTVVSSPSERLPFPEPERPSALDETAVPARGFDLHDRVLVLRSAYAGGPSSLLVAVRE